MTLAVKQEQEWYAAPGAARYVDRSEASLAQMRHRGIGPRFVKRNGRVFYRRAWLDDYMAGEIAS